MMTNDGRQIIFQKLLGGGWEAYQFQDGSFALDNSEKGIKCELSATEADTLCEFFAGDQS